MKIPLIVLIILGVFALSACSSGRNRTMNEYYDYYMSWPDCSPTRTTNCWHQRN